jgi:hypothetical protein
MANVQQLIRNGPKGRARIEALRGCPSVPTRPGRIVFALSPNAIDTVIQFDRSMFLVDNPSLGSGDLEISFTATFKHLRRVRILDTMRMTCDLTFCKHDVW